MERTENDFVLSYFAGTLDRWYCGHGFFPELPRRPEIGALFLALITAGVSFDTEIIFSFCQATADLIITLFS